MSDGQDWQSFFLAQVGASAALAGLVVVAISINLDKIMRVHNLRRRAGEAIIMLLGVLIQSSVLLVPVPEPMRGMRGSGQAQQFYGGGVLLVGVLTLAITAKMEKYILRNMDQRRYQRRYKWHIVFAQLATLTCVFAGLAMLGLLGNVDIGRYLLAFGILLYYPLAIYEAWIMLIQNNP